MNIHPSETKEFYDRQYESSERDLQAVEGNNVYHGYTKDENWRVHSGAISYGRYGNMNAAEKTKDLFKSTTSKWGGFGLVLFFVWQIITNHIDSYSHAGVGADVKIMLETQRLQGANIKKQGDQLKLVVSSLEHVSTQLVLLTSIVSKKNIDVDEIMKSRERLIVDPQ